MLENTMLAHCTRGLICHKVLGNKFICRGVSSIRYNKKNVFKNACVPSALCHHNQILWEALLDMYKFSDTYKNKKQQFK